MEYIPLRIGASGPMVRYLQRVLVQMSYPVGQVDGRFGAKTLRGVLAFQSAHELPVDGVVATNTWVALERHGGRLEDAEEEAPKPLPLPEAPEDIAPPPPPIQTTPLEEHTELHIPTPTVPLVKWEPLPMPKIEHVLESIPGPEEPVIQLEPAPPWLATDTPSKPSTLEPPPEPAGQWRPVTRKVSVPEKVAAVEAVASVTADAGPPQNPWKKMA